MCRPAIVFAACGTDGGSRHSSTQSLGDQKWWEVFQDEQLQKLIRTALQQNYDVRIAATRVLEAQAQAGNYARKSISQSLRPLAQAPILRNPATGPDFPAYGYSIGQITANAVVGHWISGENTGVLRKRRAQICWPRIGRARK